MFAVGRDLWRSSHANPLLRQGHLQPVAQNHIQMAFQYVQGWRLHILHEQPMAVLGPPHSEKAFLDVWREPSGLQFVPMASGPVTTPQRLSLLVTAKCFI